GDDGTVNRSAVTQERTTRKRAMVRQCGLGLRWTRQGLEDQQDHGSQDYRNARQMNVSIFHNVFSFVCFGLVRLFVLRSHFWPSTAVLHEISPEVTQKVFEGIVAHSNQSLRRSPNSNRLC